MDSFFIADKLRGIPLVSATTRRASDRQDSKEIDEFSSKHVAAGGAQNRPEKRDVAQAPPANSGILFKSAGNTAATSNVRRSKQSATTSKWATTTTRRPPTTPTTVKSSAKRKAPTRATPSTAATTTTTRTTRRPLTRQLSQMNEKLTSTTTTTPSTVQSTSSSWETTAEQQNSTLRGRIIDEEPISTKKFDKLIQQNSEIDWLTKSTSSTASLSAQQSTQAFNQRRTQQPPVGPQRFSDGRSAAPGQNWVVFSRPDGGYSFFELLVLFSSIIMVSTIVAVIVSNWVRAFKRRRQSRRARQLSQGGAEQAAAVTGSRSPSMNFMPDERGRGEERKISTISSGLTSLATTTTATATANANTLNDVASSSFSATNSKPEATVINMTTASAISTATSVANPLNQEAKKMLDSTHNQLIGVSRNISSEIKQAAGNISTKAMAIVQPTENNNAATPSKTATAGADSISVMSDPLADKMSGGAGGPDRGIVHASGSERNISRSASDLSGNAKLMKKSPPELAMASDVSGQQLKTGETVLEQLFNTAAEGGHEKSSANKAADGQVESKAAFRVGSLESIELPPALVESIGRSEGGKSSVPDEAPSPNLLLGEREPAEPLKNEPLKAEPAKAELANGSQKGDKRLPLETDADKSEIEKSTSIMKEKPSVDSKKQKQGTKPKPLKTKTEVETKRPENPMGRDSSKENLVGQKQSATTTTTGTATTMTSSATTAAELKNHQVVVNKLDKRKTNLEIVDLRDESVTGKMRSKAEEPRGDSSASDGNWISMDGVAVVQSAAAAPPGGGQLPSGSHQAQLSPTQEQSMDQQQQQQVGLMSPSEIIESRFRVDYKGKRRGQLDDGKTDSKDSADSKATEYLTNNIESELEQDNKMRNRKYFVYVVHDGHFTAKKECIARIELPPKRRITLAEMRQLIANSQDISLTSLRRNRFKFVTETYRLLNENEDATILHQVYPTQGVFLKLNIPEQETQAYAFKGGRVGPGGRLSTSSAAGPSSLGNTTIASRRRANQKTQDAGLPAIEVDGYALDSRARASSVSRRNRQPAPGGSYRRSKSSLVQGRNRQQQQQQQKSNMTASQDRLPSIGRSAVELPARKQAAPARVHQTRGARAEQPAERSLGGVATDLGQNVLSGAKRLFNSTFKL